MAAPPVQAPPTPFFVAALFPFDGENTGLAFNQGDVIQVLSTLTSGWWDGTHTASSVRGWFPSNYVQIISDEQAYLAMQAGGNVGAVDHTGNTTGGWWEGEEETSEAATTSGFTSGVVASSAAGSAARGGGGPGHLFGGEGGTDDLTSFSEGGEIFAEIAAAAEADHRARNNQRSSPMDAKSFISSSSSTTHSLDVDDEDFWVPKVTTSGQLFYYNSRTGETSRDMPIDGQGDGAKISAEEFPQDVSPSMSSGDNEQWSPRTGADGNSYYVSLRSGTTSTSAPAGSAFPQTTGSQVEGRQDPRASVMTGWTQRTATNAETTSLGKTDTVRRTSSAYSDESALDTAFGARGSPSKGKDVALALEGEQSATMMGRARAVTGLEPASNADKRKGKGRQKFTAELLEPPPPPLIEDLERLVTTALQEMMTAIGMGGIAGGGDVEYQDERDRVANMSEAVVTAVRTLLHSAGVLEHLDTSNAPSSTSSASSAGPIASSSSRLSAASTTLSPYAYTQLRPTTRRVSTSLSKLTLSCRAVWGVLETAEEDQIRNPEDTSDPAVTQARWALAREKRLELATKQRSEVLTGAKDVQVAVGAFLTEFERVVGESTASAGGPPLPRALLRAPKSLSGALRTNAAALLLPGGGFGGNWRGNGFVTLPTPNSSPVLPSGVGGVGLSMSSVGLSYSYPSVPISSDVAGSVQNDSKSLLKDAEDLAALVNTLVADGPLAGTNDPNSTLSSPSVGTVPTSASPVDNDPSRPRKRSNSSSSLTSIASRLSLNMSLTPQARAAVNAAIASVPEAPTPDALLKRTSKLQRHIARFLTTVEDIDIASNVDFELPADVQSRPSSRMSGSISSRPSSRRDHVSTSTPASAFGGSPRDSDVESIADSHSPAYRASVQEARPLLAEFEIGKQMLYDIAPAMLLAIQELFMVPPGSTVMGLVPHVSKAQPAKTSPLESFASPVRHDSGPSTVLEVISDLKSAVTRLTNTVVSLGAIADIQASAPGRVRNIGNVAVRSSFFGSETSISNSSMVEFKTHHTRAGKPNTGGTVASSSAPSSAAALTTALTPSSSRQSLARTEDGSATDFSSQSRDSVDSDYFFSKGPKSPVGIMSKFAAAAPSWAKRSGSDTSLASKEPSHRNRVSSSDEPSTPPTSSPSRKKNLVKVFGEDAPGSGGGANVTPRPTPDWLKSDFAPEDISYTQEGQVRGGTLQALVIAATSHEGRVDSSYLSAFLMTYRTFTTASVLLDHLIERHRSLPPPHLNNMEFEEWNQKKLQPIRARTANFLKTWVRDYMDNDMHDEGLLRRILEFATHEIAPDSEDQAKQIAQAVENRLRGVAPPNRRNLAPGVTPTPIIPRTTLRKLKFLDMDPLEVARQLTIRDSELFAKITPQECLGKAWPKEFGSEAANISAMIDMSNAVTRWVTETILAQEDLKKRANIIKHFINIASRCKELNNFSTLIHIVAGLSSTPIHRLKRTWETVNQKSMLFFNQLSNSMKPDKNYKAYRETLRSVAPPCVPFLGVYLTDWTFIGDGNPDMVREKSHQINFNKRQKASELILMIRLHQSTSYNLAPVPALSVWLNSQLYPPNRGSIDTAHEDQRLFDVSLSREPRERDDEKIARLLSESGFL